MTKSGSLSPQSRAGTVYVAVMGVALIVGVMGLASLHVARLELSEVEVLDDMARARLAARSGVECALARIKANALWRTTFVSGVTTVVSDLVGALTGGDNFNFTLVDSDGDLDDNAQDSVTIRCVGQSGNARHVIEVLMQPSGLGLSCLSASIHAGGAIDTECALTTNQTVSSNANINLRGGGQINGNAQAVGTISGSVSGTPTNGMNPPLEMPDPTNAFEYYVSNGTPITYGSLGGDRIEKVVLSPGNNPYGSQVANPQGIYVINCQGNNLRIKDCRIVGTLVLSNLGSSRVELEGSIVWEPVIPNFPALLVEGDLRMRWHQETVLDEGGSNNYNPPHTPYNGTSNMTNGDSFPGLLAGLIYVTGEIETENEARTDGVFVTGGEIVGKGTWTTTYDSIFYTDAPPGFGAGTDMEMVPGTWKQVSY